MTFARQPLRCRTSKGFTLLELLIVLALIVILAGLSLPAFTGTIRSQRLRSAAESVRTEFGNQSVDTGTGTMLTTTVSAGCATLEAWEVESSSLLERADVALAMAKAAGRDKVVTA